MPKTIAIATGGTGGHVLPADMMGAFLEKSHRVIYLGVDLSINPYLKRRERIVYDIEGANFSKGVLGGSYKIARGTLRAIRVLKEEKVDHVLGFGSFYSLPILLAASLLKIPYTLYSPDIIPGKVNRFFSRGANQTIVLFEEAKEGLKGVVTPISPVFHAGRPPISKRDALACFGFSESMPTLLVFGGSKGADAINRLILDKRSYLQGKFQIIHFTGTEAITKADYDEMGISAHVAPYSHQMREAWCAADIAICRSGAGALREMLLYKTPALLVPYPHASENHQQVNAEFMERVGGGAVLTELESMLDNLFVKDKKALLNMRESLKVYSEKEGRADLFKVLEEIV